MVFLLIKGSSMQFTMFNLVLTERSFPSNRFLLTVLLIEGKWIKGFHGEEGIEIVQV